MKRYKPKFEVRKLGRLHNVGPHKDTLHRSTVWSRKISKQLPPPAYTKSEYMSKKVKLKERVYHRLTKS